ncbi:toxin-antitoxin system antidote component [Cyanobacterium sp. HL-69]|nr:toxin-antitoxin system antidote component [Cyanobacterium sp. HL-69]
MNYYDNISDLRTVFKENMNLELLKEKREEIINIASKHGAYNVRVFGSVARGEADEKSDIDFLIDYDIDKITPWFPVRLIRELENLLGKKVDVVTVNGLKQRIKERVLQEAINL